MPTSAAAAPPDPEIGTRHVFISYAHEDQDVASRVHDGLTTSGLAVFMDRKLNVGGRWEQELETALCAACAVVVLWSPAAVRSHWVRLEARYALENDILRPARIAPCDLPVWFSQIHCARLEGWCLGHDTSGQWPALVSALHALARTPAQPVITEQAQTCFVIGRRYLLGDGLPRHEDLAFAWFQRALSAGHPEAAAAIARIRTLA